MSRHDHYAAQVAGPEQELAVQPIDAVAPAAGQVRIEVATTGICGADIGTIRATKPGGGFPIVPGHEIAGTIAEIGEHVEGWQVGDRVAVGWFGGSCGHCTACRSGDVVHCPSRQVPGLSYAGGWATTITVPATALARIPEGLDFSEAAPFGCAGVTTYNAVRLAAAPAGARVAVLGIGGLGHLAVQFAAKMGYEVAAIGRGEAKRDTALALGASSYIDSEQRCPGQVLREMGGAQLIISTASATEVLEDVVDGLAPHGQLTVVGFDATALHLDLGKIVAHARTITGHLTGSPVDTEAAMQFAVTNDVHPVVQLRPLAQAAAALADQQAGKARFRIVLTTDD